MIGNHAHPVPQMVGPEPMPALARHLQGLLALLDRRRADLSATHRNVGDIGPQLNHSIGSLLAFCRRRESVFRYYGRQHTHLQCRKYQVVVIGVSPPSGIYTSGPAIRWSKLP